MSERAATSTGRGHRRAWMVAIALLAGIAWSGVGSLPAHAVATTCDYGTSGPAADTLCWFDMAGYSEAEATGAGQQFDVALGGGYTASFTLTKDEIFGLVPATVSARTAPLEARFAFGSTGYIGVAGSPILYSNPAAAGTKGLVLTLSDIEVVDVDDNPVSGYRFVIADAENNIVNENFTWTSDSALTMVAALNAANPNGCTLPLTGIGTGTVTCTGAGGGPGPYNAVLVGSEAPSSISLSMETFARSGVAFAIQTAKLTLEKSVAGRVNASDSFDLSITSPEGTVVSSDTTGTGDTADTGSTIVLPSVDGEYVLAEEPSVGSPTVLSNYAQSWACTNETAGSGTVLPSGTGTSKTVSPVAGDDIRCTITNTARDRSITMLKQAGAPVDVDGDGLIGAGDRIPYTFDVTNTGDLALSDVGIAEESFDGTGGWPTVSCPLSTLDPLADQECTADYVLTQDDVDRGSVTNIATAHGTPPGADSAVVSSPSDATVALEASPALTLVKTADRTRVTSAGEVVTYTFTVTNTGNVTLFAPTVEEREFSGSGATPTLECQDVTELRPGGDMECEARYTVVAADLGGEALSNSAVASASTAGDDVVLSTLSTALVLDDPQIALTGSESAPVVIVAFVLLVGGGLVVVGVSRSRRAPTRADVPRRSPAG